MLQRILGAHDEIYTVGEPWIMLYPVHGLLGEGVSARYDIKKAETAISEFKQYLPKKGEEFYEGARLMCTHIYGSVLSRTNKAYFLDKTPRYYYITKEIYKVFPNAKYLFLRRDPVSILLSFLDTWVKTKYLYAYDVYDDLVLAPKLIAEAQYALGKTALHINYEDLLSRPEQQVSKITSYLGLRNDPEIINYNAKLSERWLYGDKKTVYNHGRPTHVNKPLNQRNLKPQTWRFASDYIEILGPNLIADLGYSYVELRQQLDDIKPSKVNLVFTTSLIGAFEKPSVLSEHFITYLKKIRKSNQRLIDKFIG